MERLPVERLTLRNDLYYYGADASRSIRSGNVELDVDLEYMLNMTTLIYKPDVKFFGAQYAFGAMVPLVYADIESSIGGFSVDGDDSGLGDIAFIPGILYWNCGNMHMSLAHFTVAPTGDYDADNTINVGLNYWSFDTNFAFTWLNEENGREFSFNLGHIYNTENDDTNYQTGQEIHLDVAFNQYLSDTLAVGIHGFYLKQISGDSGSGALLGSFKAEAWGIGPAVMWTTKMCDQDVTFIAKWLHEFDAENRMEGDHISLGFAMDW